ncbi:hypothetical protein EIN_379790 [Entamoeba invadens IP1]|uniref:ENTH domain-containing protein n=1 Tax=Entamoeba invadens IP1 TaxID=370355 RepID=A0A0A1UAL4_ENTIV|nr:hypothetical protein EIN_379790 [Entamoeba invadens IP1]ELP92092.1 hypothetical protein EIN_379790 [Entamoeba invadens IP1]|eukprot:XP_004258863.1 hypothetical protein EIN_379790 [Entamoeba invadens IP1]
MAFLDTLRYLTKSKEEKLVAKLTSNKDTVDNAEETNELLELYQNPFSSRLIVTAIYDRIKESALRESGYSKLLIVIYRIFTEDDSKLFLETLRGTSNVFYKNVPKCGLIRTPQTILTETLAKMLDWYSLLYSNYNMLITEDTHLPELVYPKRRYIVLETTKKLIEAFVDFQTVNWGSPKNFGNSLNYQLTDVLLKMYATVFYQLEKYIATIVQSIFLFMGDDLKTIVSLLQTFDTMASTFFNVMKTKEILNRFVDIPKTLLTRHDQLITLLLNRSASPSFGKNRQFGEIAGIVMDLKKEMKTSELELSKFAQRQLTTLISSKSNSRSSSIGQTLTPKDVMPTYTRPSSSKPYRQVTPMSALQNQKVFLASPRNPTPMERKDIFVPSELTKPKAVRGVPLSTYFDDDE